MRILKKAFVFLAIAALLAGCSTAAADGDHTVKKKVVSVATVQPDNHPVALGLKGFKEYIEERLGDRYEIRIYHNGVIGGNSEALELLQMGSLDMVATSGSNLEAFANEYKIFGLPYLFTDEQSFRDVMENERFIEQVYESTADNGFEGVAWFANGVNNFYSSKKIETPEDLKGLKVRVQASEANVKMIQGFGAAAVVMAYGEVYTALQNKVIDAGTNPEMALVSMKHGEVAKYYSRTEHQIFTDMLMANSDFLDSLGEEDRAIFEEGFELSTETANREWDQQIAETIEEARAMGVEFIEVDKGPFEEQQKPIKEKLLDSNPDLKPLYEIVQELQGTEE